MICRFGDVVREVKKKIDRNNNPYKYYIAGNHMDTDELRLLRKGNFATDDVGPAFIRLFKPGQVLYGSRRTYLRKVAVADFEGVTANTTFVLETKDESKFTQRLLPFLMQSERFTNHSILHSKGSTNPYVLFSDLCDFEFELPPMEKQRELADVLWSVEDTRIAYKELAEATEELVKSRFIEMFGDPVMNPMGWEVRRLDTICENLDSKRIPIKSGNRKAGIYPYYGASGIVDYVEDYIFDERLLLVSEDGANLLMRSTPIAFSVSGKIWVNNHAHVLRFNDEALQCFVENYFAMVDISNMITGSAQPKLNQQKLNEMMLPIPNQKQLDGYLAFIQQTDKSKFDKIERSSSCLMKIIPRKK